MAAELGRPGYHFTVPAGWINDPQGVSWHETAAGGRYELFYQSNPDAPAWMPECRWGQATSADLVRWRDRRTALAPLPGEGCWSGSVAVDGGRPFLVYTRVAAHAPDLGSIALAPGDADWRHWSVDPGGPVVPALAPGQGYAHLRDPFVWRDGDRWRMAVGAGTTDRRPAVLQYSSTDLRTWQQEGVLVEGGPGVGGPGGAAWECPQFFPLDGVWVLIVSVWDDGPGHVACAVGDYDGRRFVARSWQRFADDACYATTAFADVRGRRCALSWVRGTGGRGWAGAFSVPWVLALDVDRVTFVPHPDVDTLRSGLRAERRSAALAGGPPVTVPVGRHADVVLRAELGSEPLRVDLDALAVTVDPARDTVDVAASGQPVARLPLRPAPDGSFDLRLLVDVGLVEVFSAGAVAVARVPAADGESVLALRGEGARLGQLLVHGMERLTG